jgi:hypothetical protein
MRVYAPPPMAEPDRVRREIDWASAGVDGGTLTVALTGGASKEWGKRFGTVVERLRRPSSAWESIAVKKERIEVKGVEPGTEDDLRHFLEAAVQQVNADFAPDEDKAGDAGEESADDQRMADAFRSFAGDEDDAEAASG